MPSRVSPSDHHSPEDGQAAALKRIIEEKLSNAQIPPMPPPEVPGRKPAVEKDPFYLLVICVRLLLDVAGFPEMQLNDALRLEVPINSMVDASEAIPVADRENHGINDGALRKSVMHVLHNPPSERRLVYNKKTGKSSMQFTGLPWSKSNASHLDRVIGYAKWKGWVGLFKGWLVELIPYILNPDMIKETPALNKKLEAVENRNAKKMKGCRSGKKPVRRVTPATPKAKAKGAKTKCKAVVPSAPMKHRTTRRRTAPKRYTNGIEDAADTLLPLFGSHQAPCPTPARCPVKNEHSLDLEHYEEEETYMKHDPDTQMHFDVDECNHMFQVPCGHGIVGACRDCITGQMEGFNDEYCNQFGYGDQAAMGLFAPKVEQDLVFPEGDQLMRGS